MTNESNQPREYDAVLGGQAPPPITAAVLGGIEGVKHRLASPLIEARIAAVNEALKYGDAGLDLVIKALQDADRQVQRSAYFILRERTESQIKQALREYKTWSLPERLEWYSDGRVNKFFNRKVEDFVPQMDITDPVGTAYALRIDLWEEQEVDDPDITIKLEPLLQEPKVSQIEALVFGMWDEYNRNSSIVVNALVAAKDKLKSLKAVFIGDIEFSEWMISSIEQSDVSPILKAYPNLEVLQIRGGTGLAFSPLQHDNLKAIVIETGGLRQETIAQISALNLPELEHIELWLGSRRYEGNSSVNDLMPIFSGKLFPMLSYLGLRNSEYSDDIARAVVNTPAIEFLKVLDLSMGTLTDAGAEVLLNCPAVDQLDILNVEDNFLSEAMIERLSKLNCQIISYNQKQEKEARDDRYKRYCSVSE